MNKLGLLAIAAQWAPRLFQVRRRTWLGLGVGLLFLFGLTIWAAIALIGWFFSQAQGLTGTAQDLLTEPAQGILQQFDQVVPAVRNIVQEQLGNYLPLQQEAEVAKEPTESEQ